MGCLELMIKFYLHVGFLKSFFMKHFLPKQFYKTAKKHITLLQSRIFLNEEKIIECLAIKISAWNLLELPTETINFNSTHSYNWKTWDFFLSCNSILDKTCKTIDISRHSISLHIIEDLNFKPELEWCIQSANPNSMETLTRNLDRAIFKLKLRKENLG